MTATQRDQFLEIADEFAIEAEAYEGSYSGRGMFGETTLAVVVRDERHAHLIAGVMMERAGDGRRVTFRTDNLGTDWVVY